MNYPASPGPYDYHHLQTARYKQIKTLRIFNENVTEVQPNVQYRIDFLSGKTPFSMFVTLGPNFPHSPPTMYLSPPPVNHVWTDPSGRILRAPGLLSYNGLHSDLGRIVQAIKREFQLHTPIVRPYLNTSQHSAVEERQRALPRVMDSYPPPNFWDSISFPELMNLSDDKLNELKSDPALLKLFYLTESETRRRFFQNYQSKLGGVKEEINILEEKVNGLEDVRERKVEETKVVGEKAESLRSELEKRVSAVRDLKNEVGGVSDVCDKLRRSSLLKEEESDRQAEKFLEGDFDDVESFIKSYVSLRKDFHLQKSQSDKLRKPKNKLHL